MPKTHIQQLASKIRSEHPSKKVVVLRTESPSHHSDTNTRDALVKKAKGTNIVYLLPKHITKSTDITRPYLVISDDVLLEIDKNVNAKFLFKRSDSTCGICCEEYRLENRGCNNCGEHYCIRCQIRLIISGLPVNAFTCPFCRHVTKLYNEKVSDADILDAILKRIETELCNTNITYDQANELLDHLCPPNPPMPST